jgi:cation diffusion facilitator CzcD-associated flavoprotein CzcO
MPSITSDDDIPMPAAATLSSDGIQENGNSKLNSHGDQNGHTTEYKIRETPMGTRRRIRVIFIGMGAAGINFSYFLPRQSQDVDLQIYEKNEDLGGTWFENRYPGCACDIPSPAYQFSWQRKLWSRYYSGAKEILQYLQGICTQHNLQRYAKFNHRVVEARWLDDTGKWRVTIMRNNDPDDTFVDEADFFLNGGGFLNAWKWPDIKGLDSFKGLKLHSANWDESAQLDGKNVLVIGVGSSGVQIVPNIVDKVASLHVVARSPTWITSGFAPKYAGPQGRNFAFSEDTLRKFATDPKSYLAYCKGIESELNLRFRIVVNGSDEAKTAREFSIGEMQRKLAPKPELIEKIMPKDFGIGCRRPTPGNGFLEALCHEKTTVWTESITEITQTGFIGPDGSKHTVGAIVCATGFDTSFRPQFPIYCNGRNLQDDFTSGDTVGYLGLNQPEVPNYFSFSGPYGPLGHGSALPMIEAYTSYIYQVIEKVQVEDIKKLQIKRSVAEAFTTHADAYLQRTAWTGNCSSWFKNGKQTRKPVLWPGSRIHYLTMLQKPRYEDYEIEYLTNNPFNFLGDGFDVREYDGRDLTWYYGLLDGEDKQPKDLPPAMF